MNEEDRLSSFVFNTQSSVILRRFTQHVLSDQDAFDSHVHSSKAEKENHKHPHIRIKSSVCDVPHGSSRKSLE